MPARRKASSRPAKSSARRSRGKLAPARERRGLAATEVALPLDEPQVLALAAQINAAGGVALGAYRDPPGWAAARCRLAAARGSPADTVPA
jgi:hypothetical protein